jgi:DNA (cytosine-5)-methyltransferase 1
MTFPESFVLPEEVSDTQFYRQFGNSVVVSAVKAVAEAMQPYISGRRKTARTRGQAAGPGKAKLQLVA